MGYIIGSLFIINRVGQSLLILLYLILYSRDWNSCYFSRSMINLSSLQGIWIDHIAYLIVGYKYAKLTWLNVLQVRYVSSYNWPLVERATWRSIVCRETVGVETVSVGTVDVETVDGETVFLHLSCILLLK